MQDEKLRSELIHAIACELVQLGYVAGVRSGELRLGPGEPARLVHEEVWRAVNLILAEQKAPASS